jgi:hypothetical protein
MTIQGKTYTSDLIILPNHIIPNWWRKSGHRLCLSDIDKALKERPDVFIIGTGAMGVLKVEEEVVRHLKNQGIEVIIEKTKKSVQMFNDLAPRKRVVGAFHLTC